MVEIDGHAIHVLHERGSGVHDVALVLTHGWPGSIVEFLGVIDRLAHPGRFGGTAADGIDVVVPHCARLRPPGRPAALIWPWADRPAVGHVAARDPGLPALHRSRR